ncbi:polysaccharide biosynthesis C-terminal domain-containing protein [Ulvibacterium sp.]|uniref:oligosaccharide flippase family protein n=1 Tax=Ulvibacterium sp. TaxID=2665914 RepID=UPI003BAC76DA
MKTGLKNIFLRGITLLSKFVFIIFLGKYSIDETNLGIFGLLATTIALLIYVLGFDFYVFNTREILASKKEAYAERIRNQMFFHLIAYLVVIPISLFLVFRLNFIPLEYFWVFVVLLLSEHLGQELYRLFTTLEKSVVANGILFIRSGLWVWIVLFDFFWLGNDIDLRNYIRIWTMTSLLSFFIFGIFLVRTIEIKKVRYFPPDWKWIGAGINTAGVFFIGSLSFQVIQFSDRYMIDFFYGKKLVGIYTAFAQFTNAIDVFAFSAITMVAYPKLVKSFKEKKKYEETKTIFSKQLIGLSLILILAVGLVGPVILGFLDKEAILDELDTFYVLLGGVFLLIVSNIFHYDLYVKKMDAIILKVALAGMVTNVVLNLVLIPIYGIIGAAMATLMSFFVIFSMKFYFSKKAIKR